MFFQKKRLKDFQYTPMLSFELTLWPTLLPEIVIHTNLIWIYTSRGSFLKSFNCISQIVFLKMSIYFYYFFLISPWSMAWPLIRTNFIVHSSLRTFTHNQNTLYLHCSAPSGLTQCLFFKHINNSIDKTDIKYQKHKICSAIILSYNHDLRLLRRPGKP